MSNSNLRFCHSARRNRGRLFPGISYCDKTVSLVASRNNVNSSLTFRPMARCLRNYCLSWPKTCPPHWFESRCGFHDAIAAQRPSIFTAELGSLCQNAEAWLFGSLGSFCQNGEVIQVQIVFLFLRYLRNTVLSFEIRGRTIKALTASLILDARLCRGRLYSSIGQPPNKGSF